MECISNGVPVLYYILKCLARTWKSGNHCMIFWDWMAIF